MLVLKTIFLSLLSLFFTVWIFNYGYLMIRIQIFSFINRNIPLFPDAGAILNQYIHSGDLPEYVDDYPKTIYSSFLICGIIIFIFSFKSIPILIGSSITIALSLFFLIRTLINVEDESKYKMYDLKPDMDLSNPDIFRSDNEMLKNAYTDIGSKRMYNIGISGIISSRSVLNAVIAELLAMRMNSMNNSENSTLLNEIKILLDLKDDIDTKDQNINNLFEEYLNNVNREIKYSLPETLIGYIMEAFNFHNRNNKDINIAENLKLIDDIRNTDYYDNKLNNVEDYILKTLVQELSNKYEESIVLKQIALANKLGSDTSWRADKAINAMEKFRQNREDEFY